MGGSTGVGGRSNERSDRGAAAVDLDFDLALNIRVVVFRSGDTNGRAAAGRGTRAAKAGTRAGVSGIIGVRSIETRVLEVSGAGHEVVFSHFAGIAEKAHFTRGAETHGLFALGDFAIPVAVGITDQRSSAVRTDGTTSGVAEGHTTKLIGGRITGTGAVLNTESVAEKVAELRAGVGVVQVGAVVGTVGGTADGFGVEVDETITFTVVSHAFVVDDGITKGAHVGFVALGELEDPGSGASADGATEDASVEAIIGVVAVRTTNPGKGGGLGK